MSVINVVVLYLWKEYPWTVGWSPAHELEVMTGEFAFRYLFMYHKYEPYPLIDRAHDRINRCKVLLDELDDKH